MRKNARIICAVTAQLMSVFVLASRITQSIFLLIPQKIFQASSLILCLYRKYRRPVLKMVKTQGAHVRQANLFVGVQDKCTCFFSSPEQKAYDKLTGWYSSRRPYVHPHFQRFSSLKPLTQSKPKIILSIYRKGNQCVYTAVHVHVNYLVQDDRHAHI